MDIFIYTLTIGALLAACASAGAALLHRPAWERICWPGTALLALALFTANWVMAAAPPFGNMRHVLCFFPLVLVPACYYVERVRGYKLTAYFAAAAALSLIGALSMPLQAAWRQMPALQSPWFAPHVTCYVVSYGLIAVSALLCIVSFFSREEENRLQAADAVVRLAFPFMTFGLWSGALWADAAWSRYWAWDIKEAWSLLTWCIYLIYFHVCHYPACATWRRPLLLAGFVAVLITFFVVNLLPKIESVHSYAQ